MKNINPARYFSDERGFYIACECNDEVKKRHKPFMVWLSSNQISICDNCGRKYLWRDEIICYGRDEEVYG